MELNVVWFILVAVLFIGFFFLEGFDYGVGILLPFLGRDDAERRLVINTIGPVWDGNEVWMITAGGALFAAFPHVYATLFSGFYLALFLLLLALIGRGVAFEFRSKQAAPSWRAAWDTAIFTGSLLPALLWGVAVANLLQGVPIDANMQYTGNFFTLLSPYTLTAGLAFVLVFTYHGAVFISLKVEGEMIGRARSAGLKTGLAAAVACLTLVGLTYVSTDLFRSLPAGAALWGAVASFLVSYWLLRGEKYGLSFTFSGLAIVLTTLAFFAGLFPRLMVSSLNPAWSLTIYNSASSPYTLKLMTIAAAVMVPVVLGYQIWAYWVFRKRLGVKGHLEY
ncbi:cytochrome d ubiquinol oxidase subunit II [Acetonema longum]|uniref:Cytochrome d ubiquinol oxidase, subunit II n=1 Tax=Acetonema longum DSM 6540 TaxID=1009370 RepID=F7NQD4_9FIRM|nr:cytochrome d ubiquinol oxidase subunit II [Acetonema longum]EGO61751.1 cytochrome d ubiquinol oxidase, subunit II [Acetonema longum DSM 6540]